MVKKILLSTSLVLLVIIFIEIAYLFIFKSPSKDVVNRTKTADKTVTNPPNCPKEMLNIEEAISTYYESKAVTEIVTTMRLYGRISKYDISGIKYILSIVPIDSSQNPFPIEVEKDKLTIFSKDRQKIEPGEDLTNKIVSVEIMMGGKKVENTTVSLFLEE